jgi:hypothetical protein
MLYYFIEDNTIVGNADTEGENYSIASLTGLWGPVGDVYYDPEKNEVALKPLKPSEVHQWNSVSNQWEEPPTPPPLPAQPDYLKFRMDMLSDPGYDRVTFASNILRVTRMETAVSQNPPELPIVAAMWGVLIDELSDKPKAAEVKAWNAIALRCNVPIKFGKDGKMIVS